MTGRWFSSGIPVSSTNKTDRHGNLVESSVKHHQTNKTKHKFQFSIPGCYGFLFRSEFFFSDITRVRIFISFVTQSTIFFSQNLTLGYMTKTLNQIIIFFLHQNLNLFFSNIGNQNIFLETVGTVP
jgi:hypothetical protein